VWKKVLKRLNEWASPTTELWHITCTHSVTCQLPLVNKPRFNPRPARWYSIYLPWRDGWLSRPRCLVTYRDGLPARRPVNVPMYDRYQAIAAKPCHQPRYILICGWQISFRLKIISFQLTSCMTWILVTRGSYGANLPCLKRLILHAQSLNLIVLQMLLYEVRMGSRHSMSIVEWLHTVTQRSSPNVAHAVM